MSEMSGDRRSVSYLTYSAEVLVRENAEKRIEELENQLAEKEKCRVEWIKRCEYYRERYNALRNGLHELDQKIKNMDWNQ